MKRLQCANPKTISCPDSGLAMERACFLKVLVEKHRSDTKQQMRKWMDSYFKDGRVSWESVIDRKAAVKRLMEITGKNARELGDDDYQRSGLGGMLNHRYQASTYLVLVDLGIAHSFEDALVHGKTGNFDDNWIYPWQQNNVRVFDNPRMRISAIKWVVWQSDGDITNICLDNFEKAGLKDLIDHYYSGSVYDALVAAGYTHSIEDTLEHAKKGEWDDGWKIYPWQLKKTPRIWHMKEIRIAAVKWLVRNDDPREITREDFIKAGLGGLLATADHYKDIPYLALAEADYAHAIEKIKEMARIGQFDNDKIYPWEMKRTPSFVLEDMELKKAAMQWLAQICKKEYRDIIAADFRKNGLRGLIGDRSAYEAFLEVGLVAEADEPYMNEMKIRGLRLRQKARNNSQTLSSQ